MFLKQEHSYWYLKESQKDRNGKWFDRTIASFGKNKSQFRISYIYQGHKDALLKNKGRNRGSTGSSGTETTTGLPVYPRASEKSVSSEEKQTLIYGCGGVPREVYTTDESLENVKTWYKSQMAAAG
ncbi:MAG: hypothetical protein V5A64_07390 [Candidatus Thermoplasmatota archaeon]